MKRTDLDWLQTGIATAVTKYAAQKIRPLVTIVIKKNSRMKGRGKNEEILNLQNKIVWSKKSGSNKKPHTHRTDKESKSDKWEAKKYYKKLYWLGW